MAVESFPLFSYGAFLLTSSVDSKTILVRLSFTLYTSQFKLDSCEYLFWILIANSSDFSLTIGIFLFILNNYSVFKLKSPLSLLFSRVWNFSLEILSSYGKSFRLGAIFVAALSILSIFFISFLSGMCVFIYLVAVYRV